MKRVYLVRHGEGQGQVDPVFRGPNSKLTQKGIEQAQKVAKRLSLMNTDFDLLISSTFDRAKETTEIISSKIGLDIIFNDLFVERKRPIEKLGLLKDSKEGKNSIKSFEESFKKGEKYKDGEGFEEVSDRAERALKFLDEQDKENIVVVTHGMFSRVMIAKIILGDNLKPESCFDFFMNIKTKNTGITIIEKDEEKDNKWRLITWNDFSHLD